MINIIRNEECSGCTACMNSCPVGCIQMQEDSEGFCYPTIDKEKCIECRKCENVCPVKHTPDINIDPQAYLIRTKDKKILSECTSGGFLTTIAKDIVLSGGTAYGAVYDDSFRVVHERIDQLGAVDKLSGSKYVQSNLGDIFIKVRDDINKGGQVVFCGTPCQVAGLKKYLGREYDNLLLVDLVCHGVPSPKLWRKYLDHIEEKNGKPEYVNFRSKRLGYHVSVMEERFVGGRKQFGSARTNLMSKCYFKNVADRPICYECPFKMVSRCSDFTIFDGWHADKYVQGLKDDDRGYTIVIAQSDKAKEKILRSDLFNCYSICMDDAIALDGSMAIKSVIRPASRDVFYSLLNTGGIVETVNKLFPISRRDIYIEKTKMLLFKTGLLSLIKKIKSGLKTHKRKK